MLVGRTDDIKDDETQNLNEEALRCFISLYLNQRILDDQEIKNENGWAYAINSSVRISRRNIETGKYELVTFTNDTIKKFIDDVNKAKKIEEKNDDLYFECGEIPNIVSYSFTQFPRTKRLLKKDCGLSDDEINQLSLWQMILVEACITTINDKIVACKLLNATEEANKILIALLDKTKGSNTPEVDLANQNMIAANQKVQPGIDSYHQYVGEHFIKKLISPSFNPSGILITQTQINEQSMHLGGYHSEGLPFQIHVHNKDDIIVNFLQTHITPLIDRLAEELSLSENPSETLHRFREKILHVKKEVSEKLSININDFTFNLDIAYQNDGRIMSAGLCFDTLRFNNKDATLKIKVDDQSDDTIGYSPDLQKVKDNIKNDSQQFDLEQNQQSYVKVINRGDSLSHSNVNQNINVFESDDDTYETFNAEDEIKNQIQPVSMKIPTESEQRNIQEKIYNQEQVKLISLVEHNKQNPMIQENGTRVLNAASQLKSEIDTKEVKTQPSKNLTELTRNLSSTSRATQNPNDENLYDLHKRADKAQGNSSPLKLASQAFGIAMMAFGVGLAVLGALVVAASIIGSAACPLSAVGILPGVGMTIGGASAFTIGAGFFYAGRQKGISKEMDDMADVLSTHTVNRII